jgi:hypothetical protein
MFKRIATATLAAVQASLLTGCLGISAPPVISNPMPPIARPQIVPPAGTGPSLTDAFHVANRWMSAHYPTSRLIAAEGAQVGRDGHAGSRGWEFKYAIGEVKPLPIAINPMPPVYKPRPEPQNVPTPTPKYVLEPGEPGAEPAPISNMGDPAQGMSQAGAGAPANPAPDILPLPNPRPDRTPPGMPRMAERYMTISVDGRGRVMAPEAAAWEPQVGPVDFARTMAVSRILSSVEDMGSYPGAGGFRVTLRSDAARGPIFEVSTEVAERDVPPTGPCYQCDDPAIQPYPDEKCYDCAYAASSPEANSRPKYGVMMSVAPYIPPTPRVLYRGSYLFNAYTGDVLSRPSRL